MNEDFNFEEFKDHISERVGSLDTDDLLKEIHHFMTGVERIVKWIDYEKPSCRKIRRELAKLL